MNRIRKMLFLLLVCGSALVLSTHATAQARWITDTDAIAAAAARTPITLQFRRELRLSSKPESFPVRVSADNRFILFVNRQRVGAGPARGDLVHWRYEVLDLAPFLRQGANVIAVQVWNDANTVPLAQISSGHAGFWLSGENAEQAKLIDSDTDWQVRVDGSRNVAPAMPHMRSAVGSGFYAAAPPETIDAARMLPDWLNESTRATDWRAATLLPLNGELPWTLVADTLPQMRFERIDSGTVVRTSGIDTKNFPRAAATIPANSEASILIDTGRMLAAYPALQVSGGKGATIDVTYVEALYQPEKQQTPDGLARVRFADRATVADGLALGLTDTFIPDGSDNVRFQPFWWRVWRFAEIKVKTADQPLVLEGFEAWETGYPFEQRGRFVSSDAELNEVWRIGWMGALIDAHETYMDSAYWEQLQYIGDTRIQMLLSYAISGDTRLAINALEAYDHSRAVQGLPQAQYPGVLKQVIPPFALLWIGSLHDYWMRQPDTAVVNGTLSGTRAVLDEFEKFLLPSGLVGPMAEGWPFVDWRPGLDGWEARGKGLLSCVITMQYLGALDEAADLEKALGDALRGDKYLALAKKVREGVNAECWDKERGLYANTPDKKTFSQHATVLAVLHDVAPTDQHQALLRKVMTADGIDAPDGITGPSYYFSFYLARALDHAGLLDRYFAFLSPWRDMLRRNFTSWPETPDPSRSDTHAWSAHPTAGLLEYVAGIKSDAPGYERVLIQPHLGRLETLDAAVVHPRGMIETRYAKKNGALSAVITLPGGVSGVFEWKGHRYDIKAGEIQFDCAQAKCTATSGRELRTL